MNLWLPTQARQPTPPSPSHDDSAQDDDNIDEEIIEKSEPRFDRSKKVSEIYFKEITVFFVCVSCLRSR